ncbi:MAG: ATP-binding protein, partial [Chloroflexota bacterium]|nr:ATP-binding protein [Chloroflexota bacterium]
MVEASENYTAQDIQVLSGLEAVRRRPGMYIGSTDERGLHHLVYEIVDNSVDEAMAGFCRRVEITVSSDGQVTVSDDGRGIPVDTHPATGVSALETVMTTLHSGAKFGGRSYKVSGGLHGVGASVVNALSSQMKMEVRRDGKVYRQEYVRGNPTGPLTVVGDTDGTGTTATFVADKEIFGDITYDFDTLVRFFRENAYLNKGLEIFFRDERRIDGERTFYFEGGIIGFVRNLNRGKKT